jgi:hypothetical protein
MANIPEPLKRVGRDPARLVLDALNTLAPSVLSEILDAPGDDRELVTAWAEQKLLASESIIHELIDQRRERRGESFTRVTIGDYLLATKGGVEWVNRELRADNLPNPNLETMGQWLVRAKALYESRESAERRPRKRSVRWADFVCHCEWFVQVQVLEKRPSKISNTDAKVVGRAIKRIADLLGIPLRRRPRGRPVIRTEQLPH